MHPALLLACMENVQMMVSKNANEKGMKNKMKIMHLAFACFCVLILKVISLNLCFVPENY